VWGVALSPLLLVIPLAGVDLTSAWPFLLRAACGLALDDTVHCVMDVMPILRRL